MSAYRKFYELVDEVGTRVELREQSVDPKRDEWAWYVYLILRNGELKREGRITGHTLAEALEVAAGVFRTEKASKAREERERKYTRSENCILTPMQSTLLQQFQALYRIAKIVSDVPLFTNVKTVNTVIRRLTELRCNLHVSRGFSPGCYLLPNLMLVVRYNNREFVLDLLDGSYSNILRAYCMHVWNLACTRAKTSKELDYVEAVTPMRTLLNKLKNER